MPPAREPEGEASPLAFFATELRRLREQAGWSQGRLGQEISYSNGLISMVETARRIPSLDFAERCDQALDTDGTLVRIWPMLAYGALPSRFRPWVDIERQAHTLRGWDPLLIPGLLQTPGYARTILQADPGVTDERVEELLTARLERQKMLAGAAPPLLWTVLDEGSCGAVSADRRSCGTSSPPCWPCRSAGRSPYRSCRERRGPPEARSRVWKGIPHCGHRGQPR